MKEQFLPYQYAKMIKELGFDESGFGEYDSKGGFRYCNMQSVIIDEYTGNTISAPIYQTAEGWLWEKHGISILPAYVIAPKKYSVWSKEKLLAENDSPILCRREGILKAIEHLHSKIKDK